MDYVPAHGNKTNLADRDEISGARVFDGEDQGYGNRLRMQQLQQADWIDQQKREKRLLKEQEEFKQHMEEEQRDHLTKMLQQTQEVHDAQRKAMQFSVVNANQQLAKEKRDKDDAERVEQLSKATGEVHFTLSHDFMTENQKTEQSMLAPHRVKPYHFKGLLDTQIDGIKHERQLQCKDIEMLKQSEKEQNQLWALQTEHMRRQQLLADRDTKRKLRAVEIGHRAAQEAQRDEHKAIVHDHYNEKFTDMKGFKITK